MSISVPPLLLTQKHLTIMVLSHIKIELTTDYAACMLRYGLNRQVADIILSFSIEDIQMLAEVSEKQNIIRVVNPTSSAYWQDLKMAVSKQDRTAMNLLLIQGLLGPVSALAPL